MDYTITQIKPDEAYLMEEVKNLLEQEGITLDRNLDYTCGMLDESYHVIAAGSCYKNTLRCFAVRDDHRGEDLMGSILTHLMEVQLERGNTSLFVYTKTDTAGYFADLGFYEIARVNGELSFMENRRNGFADYIGNLKKETQEFMSRMGTDGMGTAAAIVMNANPFTLGHRYLVETAAKESGIVHLFAVSEDASVIPFDIRRRLIKEGTSDLENVILHDSGPYSISNATFPSYFLKDGAAVNEAHAKLDAAIFKKIASELGITKRYAGEEPTSRVTGIYNRVMQEELPAAGIDCMIIPRKEADGRAISASEVRLCIRDGDMRGLRKLVPETTLAYFESSKAREVIERIKSAGDVIHY